MCLQNLNYSLILPLIFFFFQFGIFNVAGQRDTSSGGFVDTIQRLFYGNPPPQAFMSTPQLIEYNGYPVETHKVTTKDGYILTLFRIPAGRNNFRNNSKSTARGRGRPVVLQHGLLSSSNDWLLLPSNVALPYLLANENFDVWLSNYRGNNYSMEHKSLTVQDTKFWDFSYGEIANFDVPAIINYILDVTKFSQLSWIGHSAGNSVFFIATSLHPKLTEKVSKMAALAPTWYGGPPRSPLARLPSAVPADILQAYLTLVTRGRAISYRTSRLIHRHAPSLCTGEIPRMICNTIISLIGGFNRNQVTKETASLLFGHWPSGTSGKIFTHIMQLEKSKKIQDFDYGPEKNLQKYGTTHPTLYNLSSVKVPVFAMYALNDWTNAPEYARKTISELPNVVKSVEVADPKWSHLDFLYGKDAKFYVYDQVVEFLSSEK